MLYRSFPGTLRSGRFLGEVGKWVPTAAARVASIADTAGGLVVRIVGVAGETVELAFCGSSGVTAITTLCTVSGAGTASASFNGKAATC